MPEKKGRLSKEELKEAEKFGGTEQNDYTSTDNKPYYDKGGHKERSIENDPRPNGHRKHK